MTLDNRAIVFILAATGLAAFLGFVPGWVFVVVLIFAAAVLGQRYRVSAREAKAQRLAEEAEDQRLTAEHAPELVGKSFVEASAYTLDAIDKFKANSALVLQQAFHDALQKHQAEWQTRGRPMPAWAILGLLRRMETALPDRGASLQEFLEEQRVENGAKR